jgi:hypothetical protein
VITRLMEVRGTQAKMLIRHWSYSYFRTYRREDWSDGMLISPSQQFLLQKLLR